MSKDMRNVNNNQSSIGRTRETGQNHNTEVKESGILPLDRRNYLTYTGAVTGAALFGTSRTRAADSDDLKPTALQVEYESRPNNLSTSDALIPRFTWQISSERRGVQQTAYHILVASSPSLLDNDKGDMWDSGHINSSDSNNVVYGGSSLEADQTYYWKVRVWDENGSNWSDSEAFTMAIPEDHWEGSWIGHPQDSSEVGFPLLRKTVDLNKSVKEARIHISGLGFYELYINGERVGDRVLEPGRTEYDHNVLYSTYEVSDLLKQGSNTIGVALGLGRYKWSDRWKSDVEMIFQGNIDFSDGSSISVVSDESWLVTAGPTISLNPGRMHAEVYDAREEKPGWTTVDYDDLSEWQSVTVTDGPEGDLYPQRVQPIKVQETLEPTELWEPEEGIYVFDLGQMIAGWVELSGEATAGTEVTINYAETLDDDGTVVPADSQEDTYIFRGEGTEQWEPRFTYNGFRYVQIEGLPGEPDLNTITGKAVHTAIDGEEDGHFESSNELLNQIHQNTMWAYLNNMHSVPTDTPTWEQKGWTADAYLMAETGIYNFDMPRFWTKWLRDLKSATEEHVHIPYAVPLNVPQVDHPFEDFTENDPPWDSAYHRIVWSMYQYYGDQRIVEDHYDTLKKYLQFVENDADGGLIVRSGLGDFHAPDHFLSPEGQDIVATSCYYRNVEIMAEMAQLIGADDDVKRFTQLKADIKNAFNEEFFNEERGIYRTGETDEYRQTSNVMPLAFGMVPPEHIDTVAQNLAENIVEVHDGHLYTGLHGTAHLLEVLSEHGFHEVAYTVATQTTYPSWGHWIENGITSLLEGFSLNTRSRTHSFFGTIDEWFYQYVAGIQEPAAPGYKKIEIKPYIADGLEWAEGSTATEYGRIASRWERSPDGLIHEVTIPENTTADVKLPTLNGQKVRVRESGKTVWNNGNRTRPHHAGVQSIERDADRVIIKVGSGDYTFELERLGAGGKRR